MFQCKYVIMVAFLKTDHFEKICISTKEVNKAEELTYLSTNIELG